MKGNDTRLNDQQFRALLHLLDDEDPEVSNHVWDQLSAMGPGVVSRLEAEWEKMDDPDLQSAVESTIHRLQLLEVTQELRDWREQGGKDLLKAWFLATKFQFPDLDYKSCSNEIKRLVNKVWLEMMPQMTPQEQIQAVNHILFRLEGYGPNTARPQHPQNSYLNYVVEQQQGNVMSITMLYLIICQQLDLPVYGVLLPGYFVLLYKDHREEFFIDVFNGGKTFDRSRLEAYLKQVKFEPKPAFFKATSHLNILLNLLQLLSADYKRADKPGKAESVQSLIREIDPRYS